MNVRLMISSAVLLAACATTTDQADLLPIDALPASAPIALGLDGPANMRIGGTSTITVTGALPGERLLLVRGRSFGDGPCPPVIGGLCVELAGFVAPVGTAFADASGNATFTVTIPGSTPVGAEATFLAVAQRGPGGANSVVSNIERVRANDGTARLRLVHASPDAPNVDIYANGGLLLADVPWLAATGYLAVPPGTYTVDIRAAGASPSSAPAFSVTVDLDADIDYTAIAAGLLGSSDPADAFRVLALADDFGGPSSASWRARIVHAGANAPTVSVDVGNDGSAEIPALARFADTGIEGVSLPAGVSLQVGVAGSIPFTVPAFNPGDEITVIATGDLTARPNEIDAFGLLAIDKDGSIAFLRQNPTVYALHGSPDAPPVDVFAGGARLIDDLAFRELSGAIQVPPGAYDLDVFDSTGSVFVGTFTTPSLVAGERYLATVGGFLNGLQLIAIDDSVDLSDDDAVVRVLHACPDAPPVQVGAILGGSFVDLTGTLGFGDASDSSGIAVPAGAYDLGVALPGGPVLFDFPGVGLNAGDSLITVATGSVASGTFGITVVDTTSTPWTAATLLP
jgi:hypothetical protein